MSTLDVADLEETKSIVGLAEKMAPVGGIFHLAMVLQDRWLSNQARTHFETIIPTPLFWRLMFREEESIAQ